MRLARFEKYYRLLVIMSAAAIGVGIVIAVLANLLIGICLVIISACVYVYFSIDEARKSMGISFKNTDGYVIISRLYPINEGVAIVPERLIYADVRQIGDGALKGESAAELCELYIPRSIEKIGKDILPPMACVSVFYEGSEEEWQNIVSETDFSGASICFDCDFPKLPPKQKSKKRSNKRGAKEQI